MYRRAMRYASRNPERLRQDGSLAAPDPRAAFGVVEFRVGRDNQRHRRVYRRVWGFRSRDAAVAFFASRHRLPEFAGRALGFVVNGELAGAVLGDAALAQEWVDSRRGVNAGAEPWSSAPYMSRERPECRGEQYMLDPQFTDPRMNQLPPGMKPERRRRP